MSHHNIIVVGASAGGVEALRTLVAGLPSTFPATVLIVLHIPAHTQSQLAKVLTRVGTLPVTAAKDGDKMEQGHIYVASTDRHLLVDADRLRVTRGPRENRVRPSIDALFRSAAYTCGPRVIGVVLTGMLDDGTAGLWAIKDHGGTAIVQSPEDAEYDSMPHSALRYVAVDYTLPVAAMPALLAELTQAPIAPMGDIHNEAMRIEIRIAAESNALQEGIMQLGPISANTCPECHGVLVRIQEGSIVRYRCHTGHAYSLETLLAAVNDEIDATLWGALRAFEERTLLLQEMAQMAMAQGITATAQQYAAQMKTTEQHTRTIHELVLKHNLFGEVTDANGQP